MAVDVPKDYLVRLKRRLRELSLVRGEVTLSSGKKSDYYLDCRLTTLDPEGSVLVAHSILELLSANSIHAEAIGGMSIGADPVVSSVVAAFHGSVVTFGPAQMFETHGSPCDQCCGH